MATFPIHQVPSPNFYKGHDPRYPLIAIVHHRMVGTLAGTDRTFNGSGRQASTNFGVGLCSKHGGHAVPCIHQYVRLGDAAWGNGNNANANGTYVKSQWNDRYPRRYLNTRTISIEHHDNGGAKQSPVRGIVPDAVIEASIWLDTQLLDGNGPNLEQLGIQFREGTRKAICRELRDINPGPHTIVDHHYISGKLKPHCWRKWMKDGGGFPQQRYLDALRGVVRPPIEDVHHDAGGGDPDPADGTHGATAMSGGLEAEVMRSFELPAVRTLAKVKANAWLYDNSALDPSPRNININPGREMPLIGVGANGASIVGYVNGAGQPANKAFWVDQDDIASTRPAP